VKGRSDPLGQWEDAREHNTRGKRHYGTVKKNVNKQAGKIAGGRSGRGKGEIKLTPQHNVDLTSGEVKKGKRRDTANLNPRLLRCDGKMEGGLGGRGLRKKVS